MGRIFPKLAGTAQENIDTKTQWLVAASTRVLPDADPEVLRSCIPRAARTGNALGFLVNDVVPDPQLLVSGSSHSCRVTHRLIRELAAAGVAGVRLAQCELCGSTKPLIKRLESGGMACQSCVRQASRTLCARCGQVRPRGRELPDGSVICDLCSGKDWYQPCSRCGRVAKARRRLGADGGAVRRVWEKEGPVVLGRVSWLRGAGRRWLPGRRTVPCAGTATSGRGSGVTGAGGFARSTATSPARPYACCATGCPRRCVAPVRTPGHEREAAANLSAQSAGRRRSWSAAPATGEAFGFLDVLAQWPPVPVLPVPGQDRGHAVRPVRDDRVGAGPLH